MEAIIERRQTAFRLRTDLLERLKVMAMRSNRSLNNFIECALMDVAFHEPNAETRAAIEEAKSGKYAGTLDMTDFDSFMKSVNDIE